MGCGSCSQSASARRVELLNPFLNVRYSDKEFDAGFLEDVGPSAAIAVGLAVRRVGDR